MTRRGWVVGGVGLAIVLALGGCGTPTPSKEEAAKAAALQQAIAPLDIRLTTDRAVALYGTDGGSVCGDVDTAGALTNESAAVVGHRFTLRKTEADPDTVAYLRAVVETYCPDQVADFDAYVDGLAIAKESPR